MLEMFKRMAWCMSMSVPTPSLAPCVHVLSLLRTSSVFVVIVDVRDVMCDVRCVMSLMSLMCGGMYCTTCTPKELETKEMHQGSVSTTRTPLIRSFSCVHLLLVPVISN